MMRYLFIAYGIIFLYNFNDCQTNECYQLIDDPYSFFSTKTAYSYVLNKQNYTQPKTECKPLQLWLLSRHGTRHPAAKVIDKISNLSHYKNKITANSTLCNKDIEAIKSWNFNLTKTDANKLNSQGFNDLSCFGLKLRQIYDGFFNATFNHKTFSVLSSPKSRCVESATSFLKSAFGDPIINNSDIPLMDSDDIKLNISKFKKIDDDDDFKENEIQEVKNFYNSVLMQKLVHRVSKTMGLDYNLTIGTVKVMYDSCRYDKSWCMSSYAAWCAVFSREDLEIIEYAEDLKYYYSNGYGDPVNERIGGPLVNDLITNFRNTASKQQGPKGVFYFGHSANVFSVIVKLGFAKDITLLLSTNYNDMRERKWKTSYLSPFASNVMAVLYECNGVNKVTFFVNEIPMVVEKHNCTLCNWELINEMFTDPIDSKTSEASYSSYTIAIFFLICSFNILKLFQ